MIPTEIFLKFLGCTFGAGADLCLSASASYLCYLALSGIGVACGV